MDHRDRMERFSWPGYDIRPVRGREPWVSYGFISSGLFRQVRDALVAAAIGRPVSRDNGATSIAPAVPVFRFSTSANRTFSFLQDIAAEEGLRTMPSWKAHTLTGNRKGIWNLLITKNWRMTFRVNRDEIEIIDLDYEDYHWEVGMSAIAGIRMKSPAHPGSFVKSEIIEPLGLLDL